MTGGSAEAERQRLIAKELQLQSSSKQRTLYFHGESMRPLLVEGDEVVVEPVEWERIRRGDIVTYRYLDRFPTRRVVGKSDAGLQLWCDNWPERRFSAARDEVLGRAVARRRGKSWLAESDLGWKLASLRARVRYALRTRHIDWSEARARARRAPAKLLRMAGLLPPRKKQ